MSSARRHWALRGAAAITWLCAAALLRAQEAATPCERDAYSAAEVRRRPGEDQRDAGGARCSIPRACRPPRGVSWPAPSAVNDRWRPGREARPPRESLDPYTASNPIKGDRPLFGRDVFLNLSATSNTLLEPRRHSRLPNSPSGNPGRIRASNGGAVLLVSQTPNVRHRSCTRATRCSARPIGSCASRRPSITARHRRRPGTASGGVSPCSRCYYERHLRDVSPRYDFDSVRVGIQPLTSDFRGFLLSDQPLGAAFRHAHNNVFQYNLALSPGCRRIGCD